MSLSTHVLDTAAGRPAVGVHVRCECRAGDGWRGIAEGITDQDGRIGDLLVAGQLPEGDLRLTFATGEWAERGGAASFYPEVVVSFTVTDADEHHHVPLLLSPYGYSTYRGS
jgi:5-hydroxyisourate hydrolase